MLAWLSSHLSTGKASGRKEIVLFIHLTTSSELRTLKLVGKIPDTQRNNTLIVHLCPLVDKVLLAKIFLQLLWHRQM